MIRVSVRDQVPDFNTMYELYDPCTVMFFFRNKVADLCAWCPHVVSVLSLTQHIMIDLGTGNNNKINWPFNDVQVYATTLFDYLPCYYVYCAPLFL